LTSDGPVIRVKRGRVELTLEQIAATLPTAENTMFVVGQAWATCVHAARRGNWRLATHNANHVRKLMTQYTILNPNDAERIAAFRPLLDAVITATRARDARAFEDAFAKATAEANASHAATGHDFIVWKIPSDEPTHLELGPIGEPGAG